MPDLRECRAFLFDMGNTLLDFHARGPSDREKDAEGLDRLVSHCRDVLGVAVDRSGLLQQVFTPWEHYLEQERRRRLVDMDIEGLLVDYLRAAGCAVGPGDGGRILGVYFSPYAEHVLVNDGAVRCLSELRRMGKAIAVVSNCTLPAAVFLRIFRDHGLQPYIDQFVFSYTFGRMKPHPSIFREALRRCRCEPGQAVMIGDDLEADVRGAGACGCMTCLYRGDPAGPGQGIADFTVGSFGELVGLLRREAPDNGR